MSDARAGAGNSIKRVEEEKEQDAAPMHQRSLQQRRPGGVLVHETLEDCVLSLSQAQNPRKSPFNLRYFFGCLAMAAGSVLATRWKDIHGQQDWKGLLDPLDAGLREEAIRYGEFVEAMYDGIDMEEDSEYLYFPLYGKSSLFTEVGLPNDYTITRYLYSTVVIDTLGTLFGFSKGRSSAWVGYVAVSTDQETRRIGRRDVVVVFRGTKAFAENWTNSHFGVVSVQGMGSAKVHQGFLSMYTSSSGKSDFGRLSLKDQTVNELNRLINQVYPKEDMSITFVGHSMGAGLATFAACDFGVNLGTVQGTLLSPEGRTVMVTAFVFGTPKVGDEEFKKKAEGSIKVLRIVDTGDIVTIVPPFSVVPPALYVNVGSEWRVDWCRSPYVEDLGVASMRCHNLELYLHCIAAQEKQPAPRAEEEVPAELPEELSSFKDLFKHDRETLDKFLAENAATVKASRGEKQPENDGAFQLFVERDFALINKSDDILKKELKVPNSWWVHPFKGMKKLGGRWLPRHSWDAVVSPSNPDFN